jgi:hypothetical protein
LKQFTYICIDRYERGNLIQNRRKQQILNSVSERERG